MKKILKPTENEQYIYQLLNKLFLLLDDSDRHFFNEYGLSARQYWALYHLEEEQGTSMVDLSRVLLTDKSNVTAIVDRLESAHYVKRTMATHDRRVILITLTAEGKRIRDYVKQRHDQHIHAMFEALTPIQLKESMALLEPIAEHLESFLEESESLQEKASS